MSLVYDHILTYHKKYMKHQKKAFISIVIVIGLMSAVLIRNLVLADTNRPPQVEPIHAQLFAPVTYYSVQAMDPDNDSLFYSWQGNISCGVFNAGTGPTASWSHPNTELPNGCPHDQGINHIGNITVQISDGKNHTVVCTYQGSESGNGPLCSQTDSIFNTNTTITPVNNTIKNNNSISPSYSFTNNMSSYNDEWIVILIALGFLWWWIRNNGLFIKDNNDPCAEAREAEQKARALKETAQQTFNSIDDAKKAADSADHFAQEAEKVAKNAVRDAGGKWTADGSTNGEGQHTEIHREGWKNQELGSKADESIKKAKDARDVAKKAKDDFERQGGDSGWIHAKKDVAKATDEWQKLMDALKVCLDAIVVAPEKKKENDSTDDKTLKKETINNPPQSLPIIESGSVISPTQEKKEERRICEEGIRRNIQTQILNVELLDLQNTRLMQDKIYSDAGNEAMKFVDWLQTVKDTVMLSKQLKGGIEGYLGKSLTGVADAVSLPDFLTWYDESINVLTRSMHRLHTIMQDKQQLGDYWLEYSTKRLTLTCSSYEICTHNKWVKHCELSIQDNGTHQRRTEPEQVFDVKELQHAISRLFIKLRDRYHGDIDRAKKFTDTCNTCQK